MKEVQNTDVSDMSFLTEDNNTFLEFSRVQFFSDSKLPEICDLMQRELTSIKAFYIMIYIFDRNI